jgi:UDP-2,3-diacylglucosamine pyrophosphatase LpxH
VGDIIDLQAIRYNASVDDAFLRDAVALAMDAGGEALAGLIETGELAGRRLLRTSHRRVLEGLRRLLEEGCELVYVPGNHDVLLRRHTGVLRPGLTLLLEDVYTTPAGLRLLVRHGDEYDRLLRLHTGLSHGLMQLQEHYSAWVNGLRALLPLSPPGQATGGTDGGAGPEAILEAAAALLASHGDWPVPLGDGLDASGGFSLAFALERALKHRSGHDRLIKRMLLRHLERENRHRRLDGVINGHTHIPEASAFAWPGEAEAGDQRPCHLQVFNDGSWARSQPRLGRTALVVGHDGAIGMVRYDRRSGITPFRPPRFPFNTYPQRPCPVCGAPVSVLDSPA